MAAADGEFALDEVTSTVRAIWSEVLTGVAQDDSNFFELGGNSLAALAICSRLEDSLRFRPALRVLFDHPLLAEYARAVWQLAGEKR